MDDELAKSDIKHSQFHNLLIRPNIGEFLGAVIFSFLDKTLNFSHFSVSYLAEVHFFRIIIIYCISCFAGQYQRSNDLVYPFLSAFSLYIARCLVSHLTPAHLNPAISLLQWLRNEIPLVLLITFCFVQLIGFLFGVTLFRALVTQTEFNDYIVMYEIVAVDGTRKINRLQAFLLEVVLSMIFFMANALEDRQEPTVAATWQIRETGDLLKNENFRQIGNLPNMKVSGKFGKPTICRKSKFPANRQIAENDHFQQNGNLPKMKISGKFGKLPELKISGKRGFIQFVSYPLYGFTSNISLLLVTSTVSYIFSPLTTPSFLLLYLNVFASLLAVMLAWCIDIIFKKKTFFFFDFLPVKCVYCVFFYIRNAAGTYCDYVAAVAEEPDHRGAVAVELVDCAMEIVVPLRNLEDLIDGYYG
nr:hypothetical protein Y57A10A.o - Caenorhabditis elegans [Caenorhabditis elegans]